MNQDPNNNYFNQNNGMPVPGNGMQPNMNNMNQPMMPNNTYGNDGMSMPNNGVQPDANGMNNINQMNNMNNSNNMGGMNNYNQMDNMNNMSGMNNYNQMNNINQMDQMGMPNANYPSNGIPMNMNSNNNTFFQNTSNGSNYGNPKNNNKKLFILIGLIIVVLIVVIVVVVSNKDDDYKSYDEYVKDVEKDAKTIKKEILKKVTYKHEYDYNRFGTKYNMFSLTSTNKKFVDISIPIKYFDASNVQVKEDTLYFPCVEAGVTLYTDNYDGRTGSVKYQLDEDNIDARYSSSSNCVSYKDKITSKVSLEPSGDKYEIIITNNTNTTVDIYGYLLYYKNGAVLEAHLTSFSSVAPGVSAKESSYAPIDENSKLVAIDKTEFVLSAVRKR